MGRNQILYLSRQDVTDVALTMSEIITAVENGFREIGNGRVEMPPKPGVHPGKDGDNFIHAMPAYIPALASVGVKWVSGYPKNQEKGLPYISGLLILNDPENGIPKAIMDCTWITAMRTGAASAISAKYLARSESSTMGILGCGVQGHTNLEAMACLFPLRKIMAFDIDVRQSHKLSSFARDKLGLDVQIVDKPEKAVKACDIVVTCGPILKEPHATIKGGWLDEGVFVSCVDLDSYFSREAIGQTDKWTTDDLAQYNYYKDHMGYFRSCPEIYADLGQLVIGKKKGRESDTERNFAVNLGLAVEDMAVAPLIYSGAIERKVGTWLCL